MDTFEIIARGFAAYVLPGGLSGNPVRDAATALTMNHPITGKQPARLSYGWAVVKASGTVCQIDIAAEGVRGGDARKWYEAFADELLNFKEPAVLLTFTKSTMNLDNVFATYDPRVARICAPAADKCAVFDATAKPTKESPFAHKKIHAHMQKRREG